MTVDDAENSRYREARAQYEVCANRGFAFYCVMHGGRMIALFYWWNDAGENLALSRAERFVESEVAHCLAQTQKGS